MAIPQNAQNIYQFLTSHGLSANAAAGILGNIEQESGGNPSAGGNPPGSGLIQQLGYPTGTSLSAAEQNILDYIKGAGGGSIADINAHASSPSAAALYFSQRYERPGIPNNANRQQSAIDVANAAKSGNWSTAGAGTSAPSGGGGLLDFPSQITGFFSQANTLITALMWITKPSNWVRVIAFLGGVALLLFAVHALIAVGEGGEIMPKMPNVVPVPI